MTRGSVPAVLTIEMGIAAIVLFLSYVLIFFEPIHRTSGAILGAVLMIGVGLLFGFYTQEEAIQALDANTLILLAAMMMVVALIRPTGAFEYVAIKLAKLAGGSQRLLLVYLCVVVSVISMFLDNVTTVIIFAPLTVLITRMIGVNPMPYLISEAILSNVSGAATLVGDPPNIMIASAADIDFTRFLVHMGPPIAIVWIVTVVLLLTVFRKQFAERPARLVNLDETKAIKEPRRLRRALAALALIVVAFFVHHRLHVYPAYVSFVGLSVGLVLLRPEPEALFGEVNWSVLFFFAGLFVIVGGVEGTGLLALVGSALGRFTETPGMMLAGALLLMWAAAVLSALVDNIPFTVAMIPIIAGLEAQGIDNTALWWALAIGVGLGGNGTHIGATANIIAVTESERSGHAEARITPLIWLKKGLPAMLAGLTVATAVFTVFFGFFA